MRAFASCSSRASVLSSSVIRRCDDSQCASQWPTLKQAYVKPKNRTRSGAPPNAGPTCGAGTTRTTKRSDASRRSDSWTSCTTRPRSRCSTAATAAAADCCNAELDVPDRRSDRRSSRRSRGSSSSTAMQHAPIFVFRGAHGGLAEVAGIAAIPCFPSWTVSLDFSLILEPNALSLPDRLARDELPVFPVSPHATPHAA